MTQVPSVSTDGVHIERATQQELSVAALSIVTSTMDEHGKVSQECLDNTTQPDINNWARLLRENEFSSNWQDEMQPAVSGKETRHLNVPPSTTRAAQRGVEEAGTLWSQPPTKESIFPMLRLPPDYIWSGEKEGYHRHVHYGPYEGFDGREIIGDNSKTSKLGDGGFGSVRRVLCKGRLLARKELRPQQGGGYDIHREAKILEHLVHRHIVELAGTYTQDGTLYILLYPVAECNLAQKLQTRGSESSRNRSNLDLLPAFGCLASALAFIHSKDIAIKHKDIKPANILFYNGVVLLADWGLSNCFKDEENSRSKGWTHCTAPYAAPEVIRREERGTAQDIFSLGLVYAEMLAAFCQIMIFDQTAMGESRIKAFRGVDMNPRLRNVLARGPILGTYIKLDHLQDIRLRGQAAAWWDAKSGWTIFNEHSLTELLMTMLAKSPADRPSAHQVLQFLKAPASIWNPCDGCLADEARRKTSPKARLPLAIPEPTPTLEAIRARSSTAAYPWGSIIQSYLHPYSDQVARTFNPRGSRPGLEENDEIASSEALKAPPNSRMSGAES